MPTPQQSKYTISDAPPQSGFTIGDAPPDNSGTEQPSGLLNTLRLNWHSNVDPQDTGHPVSDFIHNAGGRAAQSFVQPILHPLNTLKSVAEAPFNPMLGLQDAQALKESKHPIADVTGDLAASALQAGVLGAAGAGGEGMARMLPSQEHAGQLFNSVAQDVGNRPVNLTRSQPILERAMQLSEAGHGNITPLDKLYARMNQTQPLEYPEARDRASALSTLTGEDQMRATRSLKAQAKQLSHAFNQDIGDTAEEVGRGADLARAMKEYAQAARLQDIIAKSKKVLVPAAAGAAGAAGGYRIVRGLQDALK